MTQEQLPIEKQLEEIIHSINALYKKVVSQDVRIQAIEKQANTRSASSAQFVQQEKIAPPPPPPPKHWQAAVSQPSQKKASSESFEEKVGGKWLAKIGIVALVLGVSFFLKYAFDNNLIGETGRVILGIIGGIALLGLGEFLRKKYFVYSQVISGGGIAILYLSVYAAYNWYDLIREPVAFVVMTIITIVAGFLSVWSGEPALAIIGILGGFLTPFLISSESRNIYSLFIYITLLDAGILGVSFFKKWRALNLIGLFGSLIITLSWMSLGRPGEDKWALAIFSSIFFLIFTAATISHTIIKKIKSEFYDSLLLLINAISYFLIILSLFEGNKNGLSFFSFGLAIFYFVVAYISFSYNKEDKAIALFLPGLSIAFLTVAFGIMFQQHWITVAWSVEAAILAWISFQLRQRNFRVFSLIMFTLVLIRLLFFHSYLPVNDLYIILFNKRVIAFAVSILAFGFAILIYGKNKATLSEEEKKIISVLIVVANFLTILVLSQEVYGFYQKQLFFENRARSSAIAPSQYDYSYGYQRKPLDETGQKYYMTVQSIRNRQSISLSILWALYSVGLVAFGFLRKSRLLRVSGILIFGVTIFKLFIVDLWSLGQLYRIIASIGLGIILLATAFVYQKYKDRIKQII